MQTWTAQIAAPNSRHSSLAKKLRRLSTTGSQKSDKSPPATTQEGSFVCGAAGVVSEGPRLRPLAGSRCRRPEGLWTGRPFGLCPACRRTPRSTPTEAAGCLPTGLRPWYAVCMPRRARIVIPGAAHHVTQRGNNREGVFLGPPDHQTYLRFLAEHLANNGVAAVAYCLLPNHVHLVVVPPDEAALARGIGRAHFRYSQYFNRLHRRSGPLVAESLLLVRAGRGTPLGGTAVCRVEPGAGRPGRQGLAVSVVECCLARR